MAGRCRGPAHGRRLRRHAAGRMAVGGREIAHRVAEVRERTTARVLREVHPSRAYDPLYVSAGPRQALELLDGLGDPGVRPRGTR